MPHTLHKVTCKVALYNPAKSKVLVVEYFQNDFGLPGGHLEADESPEAAVRRELQEELGLTSTALELKRKDFWIHSMGKIILGFTGCLDEGTLLTIDTNEIRAAHWFEVDDIRHGKKTTGTYDDFILSNSSAG